ncbi:hypothetical protein AUO94_15640 [Planococcus kocurii]|uniref:Uncharacterized protein n=1 Tax=Planococcus kocurii TaxID=1374 RepID=A0ABN4JYJ8_9BACL|nr:hypothetical protein AUO94_15640 [Planococcus kocurii]
MKRGCPKSHENITFRDSLFWQLSERADVHFDTRFAGTASSHSKLKSGDKKPSISVKRKFPYTPYRKNDFYVKSEANFPKRIARKRDGGHPL